mmetsp:Transcript_10010/g.22433  ORF Transcript_10010/g.22433 Transcript_10010/m.22433 type:complete len:342 (+) Transcript_10010:158-1183(+)|eukprot:CAMPEP_0178442314 /NCGR_PEP_ID=MMETSP0689_2-20121128/38076_1 /TAXON_ID=160604 /ORGANISM="Amphidinium massartii, Strain CS-259" /LENGTH=341 /DNA_ID=CAMNT_0020065807 /DNA_START=154 /DNA_END=1179 /DNA_ORIENTATION=-
MSRFKPKFPAKEEILEADAPVIDAHSKPQGLDDALLPQGCQGTPDRPAGSIVQVSHFTARNWGGRHENEDRWMSYPDVYHPRHLNFHSVGVMDGHDTEQASDLVSKTLPVSLGKQLKDGKDFVTAYTLALEECEETLRKFSTTAGTCVLSATVAGRHLWCANLGDCRSALVTLQGLPAGPKKPTAAKVAGLHWMSVDHKASSLSEKTRIERAGGKVVDGRVEGLEPSRTIGDFDVKAQVKRGVISIVPEVRRVDLGEDTQAVLVCATDGVWDMLSGQDVCDLIVARKDIVKLQAAICNGPAPDSRVLDDLAQDLVQFSIAKGSRDDCTAVVAMISTASRPP